MTTNPTTLAALRLLASARANDRERPEGSASSPTRNGRAVVTWNRPDGYFDVGTPARSLATGTWKEVLPTLEKLIAA